LSTGVLTIKKDVYTDLFLVGGGGGGAQNGQLSALCNGGGGGGYTKTVLNTLLRKGTYNIVIGAGGTGGVDKNWSEPHRRRDNIYHWIRWVFYSIGGWKTRINQYQDRWQRRLWRWWWQLCE
jgi:hypothetical protein